MLSKRLQILNASFSNVNWDEFLGTANYGLGPAGSEDSAPWEDWIKQRWPIEIILCAHDIMPCFSISRLFFVFSIKVMLGLKTMNSSQRV